jgi:organic radical activating enzyme
MNDLDFRTQILDTKSASFCAAKWYNATIWLGSGQTTSCHHPPAHAIDAEAIKTRPSAIHNTEQKKQERAMMQLGERPTGCEYCWKIEDMSVDAVSDRVYKSKIYPIEALDQAYTTPPAEDVNLRTLEIAFDRTCQFACSYCNPAFSSTWVKDIKNNGAYQGLVSDGRNHFTHEHTQAQLYKFGETNPYVDAFFEWWESDLHKTLQELRITGGEPTMSGELWKLIDWFKANKGKSSTRLAINSNLGMDRLKLFEFRDSLKDIPHVEIYTSMEAVGSQAEYIRDGLDYDLWMHNVQELLEHDHIQAVHFMCTINALCLDSLDIFLDQLVRLKKVYGRDRVNFTLNILRFPSFQSPLVLPEHLKLYYRNRLIMWINQHQTQDYQHEHEINHVNRLINYLDQVKTPHSAAFDIPKLHNDFYKFYEQYDKRRNKNFVTTFANLSSWYTGLATTSIETL